MLRTVERIRIGWRPLLAAALTAVVGVLPVRGDAIGQAVFDRLRQLGLEPAARCDDATFIRRVTLDATGGIPTAPEVRAFLDDARPAKRAALIDRLLERDEFADYQAMKWCDLLRVKSEYPINLWPNAVQAYHHWLRESLRTNLPYDRFARELLTASGSNFRRPQVNFYRAVPSRQPRALAQAAALTFLGARADRWPADRLDGLAAFFALVGYKATAEWKEEIVLFDLARALAPTAAVCPDGTRVIIPAGQDPRPVFADWLVRPDNPWFARAMANRVWAWLLGQGIVDPPDDLRDDNPPVNAALLDLLAQQFVAGGYDLKRLYRAILTSPVYELASGPRSQDPVAARNFASCRVRRLEAEVLIDAVNQVTGTTERYASSIPEPYSYLPEQQRTIALADGSISSPFLGLFGRSPRDTGLADERDHTPSSAQRLHLLNSSHILRKLAQCPLLRGVPTTPGRLGSLVDDLYLTILSRRPTVEERQVVEAYRPATGGARQAALDVAWALLNTAEFQFRH